jgi:hypothetical protein
MKMSPERIERVAEDIMQKTGFTLEQYFYKHRQDADAVRANLVEKLTFAIEEMHEAGEAISQVFEPMMKVLSVIVEDEKGSPSLSLSYEAVRKIIYSHQAAYVNSEGFFEEHRRLYENVSARTQELITKKMVQQLVRDTAFLKKKFRILERVV